MVEVSTDSPDGVAPSRMVSVFASVYLPLHHKVQKFSSGAGSPGWSRKKGRKMVVVVVMICNVGIETLQVTPLRKTLASSPQSRCASCCQQRHVGSKILLQQNPPVLNCGC